MTKGQEVLINHPMMPGRKFRGVVVAKARNGYRVRYESFGAFFTETFFSSRVEAV